MRLRAPWWFKAVCLVPLLCCCTRTKEVHEQEHVEQQATVQASTEQHVEEVRQAGPETITTTVEEFAQPQTTSVDPAPAGVQDAGAVVPADRPVKPPVLIKRTVVVDERAPITDTKTAEAKGASTAAVAAVANKKLDGKEKDATGLSWLFWLSMGGAISVGIIVCWKIGLIAKAWGSL